MTRKKSTTEPKGTPAEDEEADRAQDTAPPEQKSMKDIARMTMVGDLRDVIIDLFKTREKPWQDMTQAEQLVLASTATYTVEQAVEKAVDLIAADGRKVIKGKLEQVTIKDGYKAVIKMGPHDPLRHELADAQGQIVLLVVSNADAYDIERTPVETDADDPELRLDEDGDDFEDDFEDDGDEDLDEAA